MSVVSTIFFQLSILIYIYILKFSIVPFSDGTPKLTGTLERATIAPNRNGIDNFG